MQAYGAFVALAALRPLQRLLHAATSSTRQTLNVNLTQVATIVIVAIGHDAGDRHRRHRPVGGLADGDRRALAPLIFISTILPLDNPWLGIPLAFIVPVLVAGLFGLFNGSLVAHFKIQPIIATLVLFIAGRGIAQVRDQRQSANVQEPRLPVYRPGPPSSASPSR